MTVARAARLAPARTCRDCACFPCRCERDADIGLPEFSIRAERCACGGPAILAGGSAARVRGAVEIHNATPEHKAWRRRREARID